MRHTALNRTFWYIFIDWTFQEVRPWWRMMATLKRSKSCDMPVLCLHFILKSLAFQEFGGVFPLLVGCMNELNMQSCYDFVVEITHSHLFGTCLGVWSHSCNQLKVGSLSLYNIGMRWYVWPVNTRSIHADCHETPLHDKCVTAANRKTWSVSSSTQTWTRTQSLFGHLSFWASIWTLQLLLQTLSLLVKATINADLS